MSIADNIKRAALGPTPHLYSMVSDWVWTRPEFSAVQEFIHDERGDWYRGVHTDDERRMFLLFVAYSLGAK